MNDLISRQAAIDALNVLRQEHRYKIPGKGETYSQYNEAWQDALDRAEGAIFNLPSAQPETHGKRTETHGVCLDLISRQDTITEFKNYERDSTAPIDYVKIVEQMPPAQPDTRYINANELIKRLQQAGLDDAVSIAVKMAGHERLKHVSSAQPERTCVNCGRTANNGGWYADGGTRCPIEEHYALPKDGFCHLWEKRNITDDDYPERMEE